MMYQQTSCRHEPADWIELVEHQKLEETPQAIIPKNNYLLIELITTFIWYLATVSSNGKSFVLSRDREKVQIDHTGRDS